MEYDISMNKPTEQEIQKVLDALRSHECKSTMEAYRQGYIDALEDVLMRYLQYSAEEIRGFLASSRMVLRS